MGFKHKSKHGQDLLNHTTASQVESNLKDCLMTIPGDEQDTKATLLVPLSVCTANLTHVSTKDIAGWATRSASVRRKEFKQTGHIARPLNSFMLYRSAYLNKARAWCRQNKEQVLSQVIGESWKMETSEVRAYYERFAKLEHANHFKAHPTYKFSPRRARLASRRVGASSLRRICKENSQNLRCVTESKEHFLPSESVGSDPEPNTISFSTSGLEMELSGTSIQYQHQQCHKVESNSLAGYRSGQTCLSVDVPVLQPHDLFPSQGAQIGIHHEPALSYNCMCFSCMYYNQSTFPDQSVYTMYNYNTATISHSGFPIYGHSISYSNAHWTY
jgi:hypothetical protein